MTVQDATSLGQLFFQVAKERGDAPFLKWREADTWHEVSYRSFAGRVRSLAAALHSLGLAPGERVAILSENRPEWLQTDLACQAMGLPDVPLYSTCPGPEILHVLKDSGARALFVSNAEQWNKVAPLRAELPDLKFVVSFDRIADAESVHLLTEFCDAAPAYDVDQRGKAIGRDDLASILYTSGTTGEPKGVMLSQGNFLSNCESILEHIEIGSSDRTLSFLPLSHSFERTAGHYVVMAAGGEIAYASSLERVPTELREVQPTLVLGVPRFFEKMHARVMAAVEHSPYYRRRLFRFAMAVGRKVFQRQHRGDDIPTALRWRKEIADRLVFSRLRERVGGRVRLLVSGGAPLDPKIAEFFNHAGLPLLEGYGLTETSPVVACNRPGALRLGTVGPLVPGVEVTIADDQEILVRGPNVMQGYFGRPEATRAVLDENGTFHTGDVGALDEDGFLSITDRKKDLIISAGGKNISPQKIENLLKREVTIADLCLIGDRKPFLVALLVPDYAQLKSAAAELGIAWTNRLAMLGHEAIRSLFAAAVKHANAELSPPEQIKRFALLEEAFSTENRELTPTLKVRRRVVEDRYHQLIDELYLPGNNGALPTHVLQPQA